MGLFDVFKKKESAVLQTEQQKEPELERELTAAELTDLGVKYYKEKNYEKALEYFNLAKVQSFGRAYNMIGIMYEKGHYFEQDYGMATVHYEIAALFGYAAGYYNMARYYENEKNDLGEAVRNYEKAAKLGYATAQNKMGVLYQQGIGVRQNYEKAAEWYKKAAEQDSSMACYNLGLLYKVGAGVPKDLKMAIEYFMKAADLGDEEALQKAKALSSEVNKTE